jgi:hypothetical protein
MKRLAHGLIAGIAVAATAGGIALAAGSPSVTTGSTSNVGDNSAVLKGTVNPNGNTTHYYFQWGLTNSYGFASSSHSAGKGTKAVSEQVTAGNLIPGTTYHYRIVATSSAGGSAAGTDKTFKTGGHPPPGVDTGPATDIHSSSAVLTGAVVPNGQTTTWVFQYGLTTGYGVQTFGGTVPGTSPATTVTQPLTGLEAGTVFHYRIVALHSNAPATYGADATFVTLPNPRPSPKLKASTSPHRAQKKPFVFTTSGSISGPKTFAALDCNGTTTIKFVFDGKTIATKHTAVQPNCTYSSRTSFGRLPGHLPKGSTAQVKVETHFDGNSYLAPKSAGNQTVTLG